MGRCKLECPDGETECCICCTKQDSCQYRCDVMDSYEYAQVKFGFYNTGFTIGNYNQGFYAAFSEDSYYRHELGYWCKESYVIGNIFDNKELLQEEHK